MIGIMEVVLSDGRWASEYRLIGDHSMLSFNEFILTLVLAVCIAVNTY
jgi:hypothetical protein